jgi:hypothetical protein
LTAYDEVEDTSNGFVAASPALRYVNGRFLEHAMSAPGESTVDGPVCGARPIFRFWPKADLPVFTVTPAVARPRELRARPDWRMFSPTCPLKTKSPAEAGPRCTTPTHAARKEREKAAPSAADVGAH